MKIQPHDLIGTGKAIPSLPDVYQRFTEKLQDPTASAEDFATIIESDPALALRLLHIANSVYYSFSAEITQIPRAITVVGLQELHAMVLAVSVVKAFSHLPNTLMDMQKYWENSIRCGVLSRILGTQLGLKSASTLFTAGLLLDIGCLIIYIRLPEVATKILLEAKRQQCPRQDMETRILGFDHAKVGAELMDYWKLPAYLKEVLATHHCPQQAENYPDDALLLNQAQRLVDGKRPPAEEFTEPLGLAGNIDLEEVLKEADKQYKAIVHSVIH